MRLYYKSAILLALSVAVHASLEIRHLLTSTNKQSPSDNDVSRALFDYTDSEHVQQTKQASYAYSSSIRQMDDLHNVVPCLTTTISAPLKEAAVSDRFSIPPLRRVKDDTSPKFVKKLQQNVSIPTKRLAFWENMVCGAISRSVAQTTMHPANTMKTILQNARPGPDRPTFGQLLRPQHLPRLWQGAGANFLLSVPQGAVNFAVLELVRKKLADAVDANEWTSSRKQKLGPALDFMSSAISTIACSVVSTPQMMITDNIMAGNYPNLGAAVKGLASQRGIAGFYTSWWPGLVGKIPSYALTWTFFQQLKLARDRISDRPAKDIENSIMGCIASATTVTIMIPMDTIKTRLVAQAGRAAGAEGAYKGIIDCAVRVAREEGVRTFYRGLPPRLMSVVPMIGIQFGVYEAMKKVMLQRKQAQIVEQSNLRRQEDYDDYDYTREHVLQEAAMEVAASPEHPFPAPQFLQRQYQVKKQKIKKQVKKVKKKLEKQL